MTRAITAILVLAACGSPKIVKSLCRADSDCEGGLLCEDFRCVDAKTKACEVVTDGNPILQPSPYAVAFGDLDVADAQAVVELHSIGNCTLTLFEAGLTKTDSPFSCGDFCSNKGFPIEIFPGRNVPVTVAFHAKQVGRTDDELKILSDDKEFPELRVPLHANFLGVPSLKVTPNPVDFGYVAQGRQATRKVTISNNGTGVATVVINGIDLSPVDTQDFGLDIGDGTFPLTLAPLQLDNTALASVVVSYHPRSSMMHSASLVLHTSKGDVSVPVSGNAQTPPQFSVNPMTLDLGDVPYGATNVLPLTIQNMGGGSSLKVSYMWGGSNPNTDLSAVPTVLPPIMGGTFVDVQVAYTNTTGTGSVSGLLVLSTNDPSKPSVTIPVHANGLPPSGPEVVKVEMVFDNGTDGVFDKDVRNVDLHLEHPFGLVCDKQHQSPTNWGMYGSPSWLAFPPKEEPERIILPGATVDATWRVQVSYMEDCKTVPSDLLASLLGISVDALVEYYSGGLVPIDATMLSNLISSICIDHSGSNATVRAYVNGNLIKEKTVSLAHKGDSAYAMDLVRDGGHFEAY